tara:strand:+ start:12314 stop:12547 length:234 start_codon:yes stop_codon:yes gene_type:complete
MDLQTRKLHFIEEVLAINSESIIDKLESVLKKERKSSDPVLKEKLTSRALNANEDIKAGRLNSRQEAEAKIKGRLGI